MQQGRVQCSGADLRVVGQAGAVHSAGHVDGVAPDIVLRLPSPDHPRHHGADVHPHLQSFPHQTAGY